MCYECPVAPSRMRTQSTRNRGDAYHRPACGYTSSWRVKPLDAHQPVTPETLTKQRGTQSARNSEDAYKCRTGNQCSSEDRKKRRRWRRDMGWQTMCDERRSQTLRLLISERYRKS